MRQSTEILCLNLSWQLWKGHKMTKKKKRIIITLIIAIIVILLDMWGFAMKKEYYAIESDKIDKGLRIVFVSDLHNSFYGGTDQSGIIDAIRDEDPDIVLFGGDMIDRQGGTKYALRLMGEIVKDYPCIYTPGNHEMGRSDYKDFFDEVDKLGIKHLKGGYSELEVNGQKVRVYGVYDAYYKSHLKKCFKTLDDSCYNILLAHQPEQYETLLDSGDTKFDLILSGHAHGGQWRIPFILDQGLYAPDQGIFPDRTNGRFDYDGGVQIVSRGLARQLKMIVIPRIFNRPELSVIEIE